MGAASAMDFSRSRSAFIVLQISLTACGATDHFPAYVPSKGDEVTCIQRSIWGASVEMAALLYVKKLMRHSIAPETSSAIRFASSRGFPAPNIFLITKLMLKEPT